MALTPTVADAAVIQTSWGNEIRNRTIQVFATAAEANTWAAPNGAVCQTLDTGRFRVRQAGIWVPFSACLASNFQGVTSAGSQLTFTHGLGVQPRSCVLTPLYDVNNTTGMLLVTNLTPTTCGVLARNYQGTGQANTTIGFNWIVAA